MVTYIARDGWTRVPRPAKLTPLDGGELRGIALHWTGSESPLGPNPTIAATARRLEAYRLLHTLPEPKGRGWSDCAYNVAIDAAGRVFDIRGIGHRSAANGDAAVNRTHGAVLLMLGRGDVPSQAMLDALRSWRRVVWLRRWPAATAVVGHRDLHQTACPGDVAYALVRSGRIVTDPAPTHLEDPMALSDADVERIAKRAAQMTVELLTGPDTPHPVIVEQSGEWQLPDGRQAITLPKALGRVVNAVDGR